jgi:hypothetical protein
MTCKFKCSQFLLIILLLLASCGSDCKHCDLAHEAMLSYAKEQKKNGIYLEAKGGAMMDNIKLFDISFISPKMNVSDEEAVQQLAALCENFIKKINEDEKIRPYLKNYPITLNNLLFSISYRDKKYNYPPPPFTAYVFTGKDKIWCSHWNPKKGTFAAEDFSIPYSEALQMLERQGTATR